MPGKIPVPVKVKRIIPVMKDKWLLINKLAKYRFRDKFVLRWFLELMEFFMVLATVPVVCLGLQIFGPSFGIEFSASFAQCAFYSLFLVVFWFAISQVSLMANYPRAQRFLNVAFIFTRGYFFILLLLLLVKFVFNLKAIPVVFILLNVGLSFIVTLSFRIASMYFLRIYRATGHNLRRILVIGDVSAQYLIERLLKQKDWGYEIRAIVSQSRQIIRKYGADLPILNTADNLPRILENHVVDEIFYSKKNINEAELRFLAKACDEIGVVLRVQAVKSCFEMDQVQFRTLNQNGNHALVDAPMHSMAYDFKAVTDIIFSFFGLLVLSPVLLLIALLIKIESDGPVFFKQERIGLRGRKFKLWKFRTMISNAEEFQEKLKVYNESDGPTFKIKDDPRITKLGRFLRKTGIDEIPQLVNVIKGDMSLIGPRPPVESEVKQYQRWQLRRLSVKPGITCTWQAAPNRNDIKFEKWMQMDLNYIDNWSLKKDFQLVFKTISAMMFAHGR